MPASSVVQDPVRMEIKLFESGDLSDCKIICNGREFRTHRLILSYRSQYFRKALNGNWEESQTAEVKLEDHEPKKIEWLLRFIYHQDLDWHRAEWQGQNSILPMLVELIDLGDYFLVDGLIDAAREAILDLCGSFAVEFRCFVPGETTDGDGIAPTVHQFLEGVVEAINLTSASICPTRPLRKFFMKFLIDVSAPHTGVFSAWFDDELLAAQRQFRRAKTLRDLVTSLPGIEDELTAALYQSELPKLKREVSSPSWNFYDMGIKNEITWEFYVQNFKPEKTCSACSCHLDDGEAYGGLEFANEHVSEKGAYCLRCVNENLSYIKYALKDEWKNLIIHDGSLTDLLPQALASTGQELPQATA